jgi:hypothetical protein
METLHNDVQRLLDRKTLRINPKKLAKPIPRHVYILGAAASKLLL